MPRDLPGFFWDSHRNRYFPTSTNHPVPPPQTHLQQQPRNHPRTLWQLSSLRSSQGSCFTLRHDVLGLHFASTNNLTRQHLPIIGHIRSFLSTTADNTQTRRLIADSAGWIYSSHPGPSQIFLPILIDRDSEISSLALSDVFWLATTFASQSKVAIGKIDDFDRWSLFSSPSCIDIRCSSYTTPNELVVGAKQHAVYFTNTLDRPKERILKTHSDVFSVLHQQNLVYAGTRNGSIHRFDLRVPNNSRNSKNDSIIFTDKSRPTSTVLHMQFIGDHNFLTSRMNGELMMYDIRYTRYNNNPILQFHGHVNTHTSRLGITTTPDSQFLFAASQDRKIRGWSLCTGESLIPPPQSSLSSSSSSSPQSSSLQVDNPLLMKFEEPVEMLTITWEVDDDSSISNQTDEGDDSNSYGRKLCLWAGCGNTLYNFGLGCRE